MQSQRIAGAPSAQPSPSEWTGKVIGLGVTDVLQVELEPCQLPSLVEELDLLRYSYEDAFRHDRARLEAIPQHAREARLPHVLEAEKELDVSEFCLRAVDIVRAQVPDSHDGESPVVIYGPARIIAELVREATRFLAERLMPLLEHRPRSDVEARARLAQTAAALRAWTELYVECEAIEWFAFAIDPAPTGV